MAIDWKYYGSLFASGLFGRRDKFRTTYLGGLEARRFDLECFLENNKKKLEQLIDDEINSIKNLQKKINDSRASEDLKKEFINRVDNFPKFKEDLEKEYEYAKSEILNKLEAINGKLHAGNLERKVVKSLNNEKLGANNDLYNSMN